MGTFMDAYNKVMKEKFEFDDTNFIQPIEGVHKPDNVKRFEAINIECAQIYAKKNKDYGNSFDQSLDEDGLLVAKIRLGDKYKRFSQLIRNEAEVKDESLRDTLVDMANYAKMTILWLDAREAKRHPVNSEIKPVTTKHDDSLDAITYALNDVHWTLDADDLSKLCDEDMFATEEAKVSEGQVQAMRRLVEENKISISDVKVNDEVVRSAKNGEN